jgi:hypothetical protein
MLSLISINKKALNDKISKLNIINNHYPANDLINIISNSKETDKRLINDFIKDIEIVIYKTKHNNRIKSLRYFTELGIKRYLKEGKIFSYNLICEIFQIIPTDKEQIKLEKILKKAKNKNLYKTSIMLKWIYNTRKQSILLKNEAELKDIIQFVESDILINDNYNKFTQITEIKKKLALLKIT